MGDRKQTRDMNRMLDNYLDELPANRRSVSTYIDKLVSSRKKKKKKTAAPVAEEEPIQDSVLTEEIPEDRILIEPGPSFIEQMLTSARNFFKGPTSEADHLGEMEVVDLPEIEEGVPPPEEKFQPEEEQKATPRKKGCWCNFFCSLFGRTKEETRVNEEEEARVTKLVLYKDRTEKEVRFLLKLIDNLYPRVYKRTRDTFEKSPDYQIFKKVRERYIIEED